MGLLTTVAGTVAGGLARGLGGLFTRRRTVTDDNGAQREVRTARPFTVSLGVLLACLLLYHFLLWPILNFHYPEYGFPPIDVALLSALAGLGM